MSRGARRAALGVLAHAPADSGLWREGAQTASSRRERFLFAGVWPDVVRDRDAPQRRSKYHRGDWHYADIFWKQEGDRARILADVPRTTGIAVSKLGEFERTLRDPTAAPQDKAIALAWFLHVAADLHNPLHTASRVTATEQHGDRGGNRFVLRPGDDEINLHGYWDSILRGAQPVSRLVRGITREHPFRRYRERLVLGDYEAWNREGLALLPTVVYSRDLRRGRMPPESYRRRAYATALERLALAGYRIGETLNDVFSPASPPRAGSTAGPPRDWPLRPAPAAFRPPAAR